MKIVIDIPNEVYTYVKREWEESEFDSVISHVFNGIKNCVVLPEHHGRLIDADALMKSYSQFEFCSDMGDAMEILDNVPSIIERSDSE